MCLRVIKMSKMNIIDCKEIAQKIKDNVKNVANGKGYQINVLTNPYDEPSKAYVKNKKLASEYCGIKFNEIVLDENTMVKQLFEIKNSNIPTIVQLPICDKLNGIQKSIVLDIMNSRWLDCDGFAVDSYVKPATANGVMKIFEEVDYDLTGKHVCVIGRGKTCAKPLINMILDKDATVTVCHSKTEDLVNIANKCDVIISCVGQENLITVNHVKDGAVVINVGLTRNNDGKLVGDVDFENVKHKTSYITKNIGGVGLLTVACLMDNVVKLYEYIN
jgi:methylenetetrahydrofolate dehydrogenase (NADP+)/methenyltetrahydrofolate cyclohydrolase